MRLLCVFLESYFEFTMNRENCSQFGRPVATPTGAGGHHHADDARQGRRDALVGPFEIKPIETLRDHPCNEFEQRHLGLHTSPYRTRISQYAGGLDRRPADALRGLPGQCVNGRFAATNLV